LACKNELVSINDNSVIFATNSFNSRPIKMKDFTLNTGARIPAVGFGTWKAAPGEAAAAVEAAFEAGYRHFVSNTVNQRP
jgi:hypothetical protein